MAAFTESKTCLLTKEYPAGGNIFAKVANWFKKADETRNVLIDPIETILRVKRTHNIDRC